MLRTEEICRDLRETTEQIISRGQRLTTDEETSRHADELAKEIREAQRHKEVLAELRKGNRLAAKQIRPRDQQAQPAALPQDLQQLKKLNLSSFNQDQAAFLLHVSSRQVRRYLSGQKPKLNHTESGRVVFDAAFEALFKQKNVAAVKD